MKKIVLGVFTVLCAMLAFAASAGDLKMPPSALSTESPNKDKVVVVAKFGSLGQAISGVQGEKAHQLTLEALASNRPTIASSTSSAVLCNVKSIANPVFDSTGICVAEETHAETITVADIKIGKGGGAKIQNTYEMPRNQFYGAKSVAPTGSVITKMTCHVIGGNKAIACMVLASNK